MDQRANFEETTLLHLDAAYNLARWLTNDASDAEDVVQEAYLRAFRFFAGFRGGDSRAWVLKIVRNTFYTWLQRNHAHENLTEIEDDIADAKAEDPETLLIAKLDLQVLMQLVKELPRPFCEVIVMRDIEELSYKEISIVTGLPLGTVMSRLARARRRLQADALRRVGGER